MSEALETRAEILKLARLLRRDPRMLDYLESVPAADIRTLRDQVTDMLFTAHGNTLNRLAAASKVLPVGLVATLGERTFGPVLSARVAGVLEPSRAVELAAKLPNAFLADVAIDLDPRRASAVLGAIPPRQIADIGRELVRRNEYVTMGRFVGHLPEQSIAAAVAVMDDATVLRVAFVLEEKDRLDQLVELLGEDRLEAIIDAAARDQLWPEALDLLAHLSEARQADFAARAARRDDAVLDSLIAAAQEHGLWDAVLPVTASMSDAERRRFAMRMDPEQREQVAAAARAAGMPEVVRELEQA